MLTNNSSYYQNEVRKLVDSGSYFTEASDWYTLKYVYIVSERSFFIVLTLLCLATSFFAVRLMLDFLPLTRKIPVAIELQDLTREYTQVRRIGVGEEDPNIALMRYLLMRFVESFEQYNDVSPVTRNIESNFTFVRQYGDTKVNDAYRQRMSNTNATGPILVYRNHTARNIKPQESSFRYTVEREKPESLDGTYTISIIFEASEESLRFVRPQISRWVANVKLQYRNIHFDKAKGDFEPLQFKVLEYSTRRLE